MIINCNVLWTQLVSAVYRVGRRPVITTTPPPPEVPPRPPQRGRSR